MGPITWPATIMAATATDRSGLFGLFHSELGGRVGFETAVGNGHAAADGPAVGALVEPGFGPLERGQPVAQAGGDGVVEALGGERLGRIGQVTGLVGRRSVGVSTPLSADSTSSRGTDTPNSTALARSCSRSASVSVTC